MNTMSCTALGLCGLLLGDSVSKVDCFLIFTLLAVVSGSSGHLSDLERRRDGVAARLEIFRRCVREQEQAIRVATDL